MYAAPAVAPSRDQHLAALVSAELDLLIVGGGITGAALAYAAAHTVTGGRRLRVGLVEAADFASGTSSCSSRLLHGGLRYLAQGRLPLVRALLQGRREVARIAPHLVQPTRFLLPLGPRTPHAPWKLRAALRLYRWLEGRSAVGEPPDWLAAWQLRQREPLAVAGGMANEALSYGELAVHDARLVVELCLGAAARGAAVVSRVRCQQLLRDGPRVVGAMVADRNNGRRLFVRARVVVNAAGPAADSVAAGPAGPLVLSRGSHLVLPAARLPLDHTVVFFSGRDGRALFASPRGRFVLVGTTEVPHLGPTTAVAPAASELRYLFEAVQGAFPAAGLRPSDVAWAFAGVRPLADPAAGDPEAMDRGYRLAWDAPGLLALRGGKLTLAPAAARSALRAIHRRRGQLGLESLAVPRQLPPLPAAVAEGERPFLIHQVLSAGLSGAQAERLVGEYGRAAADIAAIVTADPSSSRALWPGLPHLQAELVHARQALAADGFEDFARRRSDLAFDSAVAGSRDRPGATGNRRAA